MPVCHHLPPPTHTHTPSIHLCTTTHTDDATYVGGLFVTLQSLLDSLDSIQAKRATLAGLLAQHGAGVKKKSSLQASAVALDLSIMI